MARGRRTRSAARSAARGTTRGTGRGGVRGGVRGAVRCRGGEVGRVGGVGRLD
ncbi:MAG: 30S ribosomal protein S18, partial [Nitriliruptor sp.]